MSFISYIALLSFLTNSLSIIYCLGVITRYYMLSFLSWIDYKLHTVLFSYFFQFKSNDEFEFGLTFDAQCLEVISNFLLRFILAPPLF